MTKARSLRDKFACLCVYVYVFMDAHSSINEFSHAEEYSIEKGVGDREAKTDGHGQGK